MKLSGGNLEFEPKQFQDCKQAFIGLIHLQLKKFGR